MHTCCSNITHATHASISGTAAARFLAPSSWPPRLHLASAPASRGSASPRLSAHGRRTRDSARLLLPRPRLVLASAHPRVGAASASPRLGAASAPRSPRLLEAENPAQCESRSASGERQRPQQRAGPASGTACLAAAALPPPRRCRTSCRSSLEKLLPWRCYVGR